VSKIQKQVNKMFVQLERAGVTASHIQQILARQGAISMAIDVGKARRMMHEFVQKLLDAVRWEAL